MDLQAAYWKEREQIETITLAGRGFLTYKWLDDGKFYIVDVYVAPACRKSNVSALLESMAIEIAKKGGVSSVLGSVQLNLPTAADSIAYLSRMGYRFYSLDGFGMYFIKEV